MELGRKANQTYSVLQTQHREEQTRCARRWASGRISVGSFLQTFMSHMLWNSGAVKRLYETKHKFVEKTYPPTHTFICAQITFRPRFKLLTQQSHDHLSHWGIVGARFKKGPFFQLQMWFVAWKAGLKFLFNCLKKQLGKERRNTKRNETLFWNKHFWLYYYEEEYVYYL